MSAPKMSPEERAAKREAVIQGMIAKGHTRERAEEIITYNACWPISDDTATLRDLITEATPELHQLVVGSPGTELEFAL